MTVLVVMIVTVMLKVTKMKNSLKKHIRNFSRRIVDNESLVTRVAEVEYFSVYLRNPLLLRSPETCMYYYSAIKYDPLNPDWINMVCKARIRLIDYAVKHWGNKPWEMVNA